MAFEVNIPVRDRHAFRPDLHEAELEDRVLLAIGPPSAYLMVVTTSGFGNYFNVPGFSLYFGSGQGISNNRASGPIGATSGLATPGPGLTMNGANFNNSSTGGSAPRSSTLPSPYSGSGGSDSAHNSGPTGTSSAGNTVSGYGTSFSAGGNFAASYSGTYNGFNTRLEFSASNADPRASGSANSGNSAAVDRVLEEGGASEARMGAQENSGNSMSHGTNRKADNLPHPSDPFSFFRRSPTWQSQGPRAPR